jgi:hypothetical protein
LSAYAHIIACHSDSFFFSIFRFQVRKAAIQLLSTLLQNNPFLGDLSSANFKAELQALEKDFQVLHRAEIDKELQDSERILAENSIEMLDDKKAAKAEERTDQSDSDVDEMEVDESKAEPATGESSKLLSASTEEIESQKRKVRFKHVSSQDLCISLTFCR